MAYLTWPTDVSQCVLRNGFQVAPTENVVRAPTATGPGKVRRRASSAPIMVPPSVIASTQEKQSIMAFWKNTVKSGALRFIWPSLDQAIDGDFYEYQFEAPPTYAPYGADWRVSMQLSAWHIGEEIIDGFPVALVIQFSNILPPALAEFAEIQ